MLVRSLILTTSIAALAGCGSISSTLGLERHVPDETQVVVRPTLTLPPDYDLMPPGTPSAVSAEHEGGTSSGTSAQPGTAPKDERGFFGKVFHGDFFGNEPDAATAKEHAAAAPAPNVEGTPQAPAPEPAASVPPAAVTTAPAADAPPPAPEPKKEDKGFFGKLFSGDLF
jgi:hypothetical protein